MAEKAEVAKVEQAGTLWNEVGFYIKDMADYAGAKAAFERALKIFKQYLPEGHPNIKVVEGNLRSLEEKQVTSLSFYAPTGVKRTVETVEKVPSQKLTIVKWDKTIGNCPFCVLPNNILAIFEPAVGDFCEVFSNKWFFDSLVRRVQSKGAMQESMILGATVLRLRATPSAQNNGYS